MSHWGVDNLHLVGRQRNDSIAIRPEGVVRVASFRPVAATTEKSQIGVAAYCAALCRGSRGAGSGILDPAMRDPKRFLALRSDASAAEEPCRKLAGSDTSSRAFRGPLLIRQSIGERFPYVR